MYTGTNPSALRSKQWLHDALLQILEKKQYSQISVKDICLQADLSRQTFYKIYKSKDEIMEYHFTLLFHDFIQKCNHYRDTSVFQIILCFFQFFLDNKAFFSTLVENNMTELLTNQLEQYLHQVNLFQHYSSKQKFPEYDAALIAGSLTRILIHWYQENFELNIQEISSITYSFLTGAVFQSSNAFSFYDSK